MSENGASQKCDTSVKKDAGVNGVDAKAATQEKATKPTPTSSANVAQTQVAAQTSNKKDENKDEEFESDEFDSEWSEWKEILEDWFADIFDDLVSYASEDDGSELGFETDSDAYNSDGGYEDWDDWDDF